MCGAVTGADHRQMANDDLPELGKRGAGQGDGARKRDSRDGASCRLADRRTDYHCDHLNVARANTTGREARLGETMLSVQASKHDIIRRLFVDTADETYIVARWCYAARLDVDFFWNAVHALEKYLKAVLLFNGRSSRNYGHDITRLYTKVASFAGELLPSRLEQPGELDTSNWRSDTPVEFIAYLYRNGRDHNRYQVYGYFRYRQEVFKLDQLVFAIRRLCCPLDAPIAKPGRETHRAALTESPTLHLQTSASLETIIRGKRQRDIARDALLNLNMPFAPTDFEHGHMRGGYFSARNPVLNRRLLKPLEESQPGSEDRAEALMLRDWVLQNIQLPREIERELNAAG